MIRIWFSLYPNNNEVEIIEKKVSEQWVKLSSYVFMSAEWTINCEQGRTCEVGTGIYFRRKPRGSIYKFSSKMLFTTYGAGYIMVRVIDGKGDCNVQLDEGDVGLINIYSRTFWYPLLYLNPLWAIV